MLYLLLYNRTGAQPILYNPNVIFFNGFYYCDTILLIKYNLNTNYGRHTCTYINRITITYSVTHCHFRGIFLLWHRFLNVKLYVGFKRLIVVLVSTLYHCVYESDNIFQTLKNMSRVFTIPKHWI